MPEQMQAQPYDATDAVVVTRTFAAPRAQIFKAWSDADHVKRWFAPDGFTVPDATVEFRAGGAFDLCMRGPGGVDNWMRGRFDEVAPPERLAFTSRVEVGGALRFVATTLVVFEEADAATRLTVRQSYDVRDPAFAAAVKGAPLGWSQTLAHLRSVVEAPRAGG